MPLHSMQFLGDRAVHRFWGRGGGVLLIRIMVGQGPTALAVGAGGCCLDTFFYHLSVCSSFFLSLGDGPI